VKITPLDIKKQEFKRSFRGYDPVEVETFLEMVADEYEALLRERNNLSDEVLKLRTQLRDYQEVERALKDTLMNAQQAIAQSRENSRREADLLIREAELRAEKTLEDAKKRLAELKNELLLIKAQKDSFARRLHHLLESQLELLGVLELDDLGFGEEKSPETRAEGKPLSKFTGEEHKSRLGEARPPASAGRAPATQDTQEPGHFPQLLVKESETPPQSEGAASPGKDEAPSSRPKISDQLIV